MLPRSPENGFEYSARVRNERTTNAVYIRVLYLGCCCCAAANVLLLLLLLLPLLLLLLLLLLPLLLLLLLLLPLLLLLLLLGLLYFYFCDAVPSMFLLIRTGNCSVLLCWTLGS